MWLRVPSLLYKLPQRTPFSAENMLETAWRKAWEGNNHRVQNVPELQRPPGASSQWELRCRPTVALVTPSTPVFLYISGHLLGLCTPGFLLPILLVTYPWESQSTWEFQHWTEVHLSQWEGKTRGLWIWGQPKLSSQTSRKKNKKNHILLSSCNSP